MPQAYVTPGVQALMNAYERQASNINSVKQRNAILRQQQWAREYDYMKSLQDQMYRQDELRNEVLRTPGLDAATMQKQLDQLAANRDALMTKLQAYGTNRRPRAAYDAALDTNYLISPELGYMNAEVR